MKNLILSIAVCSLIGATQLLGQSAKKPVRDNTGGASAIATFRATVNRPLTIESVANMPFEIDLGTINPGETKTLGENYSCTFHLMGMPNYGISIELLSEAAMDNGAVINGFVWQASQTSPSEDWNAVTTVPFSSQLNYDGHCWVKIYPVSMTAPAVDPPSGNIVFQYRFNCTYSGI